MAASREWTEWHLTPAGWQRGSEKVDGPPATIVEPPADRVQTVEYQEELASSFSSLHKTTSVLWQTDDIALLDELLAKYGEAPHRL